MKPHCVLLLKINKCKEFAYISYICAKSRFSTEKGSTTSFMPEFFAIFAKKMVIRFHDSYSPSFVVQTPTRVSCDEAVAQVEREQLEA